MVFLEMLWSIFACFHTLPLSVYIFYMKHVAEKRPWNVRTDPNHEPALSLIIPTYQEEITIQRKLDNLFEVDYPKEKMELIVVDTGSRDATVAIVKEWTRQHPELRVKLVQEETRKSMVQALNIGVQYASAGLVVKTDADCMLLPASLKSLVSYAIDPEVGSVAGLHRIEARRKTSALRVEKTYRQIYRWLRIGESKLQSTVLYEGELMLVKKKVLEEMSGFDERMGADDVPTALGVAKSGYRAITAEDAHFVEMTPYSWREKFRQKTRRGRHVLQTLWHYRGLVFKKGDPFHRFILPMEIYMYVINPLIAVPTAVLSLLLLSRYPYLLLLAPLLLLGPIRQVVLTHVTNVLIMLMAVAREMAGKQGTTWSKVQEIR